MKTRMLMWYLTALILAAGGAFAQTNTQVIRGTVKDVTSEQPLEGATVTLTGRQQGATTDKDGRFELTGIAPGRVQLMVSYNGYKTATIPEVLVSSGKEVTLEVGLEQQVTNLAEVVVRGRSKKGSVSNEYITGSATSFNPEEVQRFAGGRNDPSKMVSNYAGVVSGNDSRNDIVVRGNSPTGVLWRIEGLPAPNPNHFGALGTSGGPVTLLNTNALKSADFLTGAFPAEYGNATAAVFDISLRQGNTNRHERTLQLNAFSGLEAMLEGPMGKKGKGASYLFGYRYSFVQLAQSFGLSIGTDAVPKYQDWVFNLDFGKTGKHRFSVYGLGGVSSIDFLGKDTDTTDFYARQDQDSYVRNNVLLLGAKHTWQISANSYLRSHLSYSSLRDNFDSYQYPRPVPPYQNRWLINTSRNDVANLRWHTFYNNKINARLSLRTGIMAENNRLESSVRDREGKPENLPFDQLADFDGDFTLLQGYAQVKYKPVDKLTLQAGLHTMYLTLNESSRLSPRLSASYEVTPSAKVYAAFGNHAQMQPLPVYLLGTGSPATNENLNFTQANHYVVGAEKRLGNNWKIKLEAYHQYLFDVPVEQQSTGFSLLNEGANFTFTNKTGLVNRGTGTNTGVEFTIERNLNKGWYLLATGSLFDSKYKGSDGVERNTVFNYGAVGNILGGRELPTGKRKQNAFTIDLRASFIGGRYQTPVNVAASIAAGKEVLDETRYNSEQLDSYFRLDTKFGFRLNSKKKRFSQTFYLDLQNVTNRENIFLRRFNALRGTVGNVYQLGFFPDIMWKVQF